LSKHLFFKIERQPVLSDARHLDMVALNCLLQNAGWQ